VCKNDPSHGTLDTFKHFHEDPTGPGHPRRNAPNGNTEDRLIGTTILGIAEALSLHHLAQVLLDHLSALITKQAPLKEMDIQDASYSNIPWKYSVMEPSFCHNNMV
jgi:hypothetical protein